MVRGGKGTAWPAVPARDRRQGPVRPEVLRSESQRVDDLSIRLRSDLRPQTWSVAVKELRGRLCLPEIDDKALSGLKFSDALPRHLAVATLATRLADLDHAAAALAEPVRFERSL